MKAFEPLFVGCYFASYGVIFLYQKTLLVSALFCGVWFIAYFYSKKRGELISPWLMLPGMILALWLCCSVILNANSIINSERPEWGGFACEIFSTFLCVIAVFLPFLAYLLKSNAKA
ncbi:MAG: hypothetical protein LUD52_03810 [Opitutae bacterium]|nr:hypothetical protein [Opitutae bacterium]